MFSCYLKICSSKNITWTLVESCIPSYAISNHDSSLNTSKIKILLLMPVARESTIIPLTSHFYRAYSYSVLILWQRPQAVLNQTSSLQKTQYGVFGQFQSRIFGIWLLEDNDWLLATSWLCTLPNSIIFSYCTA